MEERETIEELLVEMSAPGDTVVLPPTPPAPETQDSISDENEPRDLRQS